MVVPTPTQQQVACHAGEDTGPPNDGRVGLTHEEGVEDREKDSDDPEVLSDRQRRKEE